MQTSARFAKCGLGFRLFCTIYFVGTVLGFNEARRSLGLFVANEPYQRGAAI